MAAHEAGALRKITRSTEIKGHHAAASPDNPEFIVEAEEGKRAAHKAGAVSKE